MLRLADLLVCPFRPALMVTLWTMLRAGTGILQPQAKYARLRALVLALLQCWAVSLTRYTLHAGSRLAVLDL